ncbi:MAG: hypothetical protein ACK5M7_16310 [Draconibacterium sp.]
MKNFYQFTKPCLFIIALLLGFAARSQESLKITIGDITLDPMADTLVTAEFTSGGNLVSDAKIGWITEPGYLGKVDKNGLLVANHPGEGYLIAKYKDLRDSVHLLVTGTPKTDDHDTMEDVYPKIKIVPDNIRVEISDSVELRAFYIDTVGIKTDTTFEWWVEPMEVGIFSDSVPNQFYSSEIPGKGIIIARLGDLADTAKITVYETRAKKEKIQKEKDKQNNRGKQLTITPDDMTVYTGHDPIQYTASYKTNGVKHQDAGYNWSVTDTSVAKIDENGLLTLSGETGMTLVTANYSNFEASVELLVVDSTVDMVRNTISIRRVLPNGNELHPKYFKEGESYKIGGLPYPLNILNAGMLHFPFGCINGNL